MSIEPKTLTGKLVGFSLLVVLAIGPTYFVYSNGYASFEFGLPVVLVIGFLVIFITAVACSLFGIDLQISNKEQDEIFIGKINKVVNVIEKLRWPLIAVCVGYIAYYIIKAKYGI